MRVAHLNPSAVSNGPLARGPQSYVEDAPTAEEKKGTTDRPPTSTDALQPIVSNHLLVEKSG